MSLSTTAFAVFCSRDSADSLDRTYRLAINETSLFCAGVSRQAPLIFRRRASAELWIANVMRSGFAHWSAAAVRISYEIDFRGVPVSGSYRLGDGRACEYLDETGAGRELIASLAEALDTDLPWAREEAMEATEVAAAIGDFENFHIQRHGHAD